jgi:tetratricopeptide (TPR) repeat protein
LSFTHAARVLQGRFELLEKAGSGGMGVVHRAVDLQSGVPVAIKFIVGEEGDIARFVREAQVLARLRHPAVVRYVAHGTTDDGKPFLAMEWLEGEDLGARLARQGCTPIEAITLVGRIASGLATAHAQGVVHRDIKPSNVFLVGKDPATAKLLDFGIARVLPGWATTTHLTRSGVMLGTIGYMAPEQALSTEDIDARADVFSLGAVLFECLTGAPPFSAKKIVGVLAKILREDAPRIRESHPELPQALDDLVARMMSRDRAARPPDAAAVVSELASVDVVRRGSSPPPFSNARGISEGEQRFVSVIVATGVVPSAEGPAEIARRYGTELLQLVNGVLVLTLESPGSPNEQAMRAAACALALRVAFPAAHIALATGRTSAGRKESPAVVVDHAASLLVGDEAGVIRVDDVTAALLGNVFEVVEGDHGLTLHGFARYDEEPRRLLGTATPCVGREKELAFLQGAWRECVEDSVARAVVVTGPPGQGKSRLRHELLVRLNHGGEIRAIVTRADAVGAGSTFLIVRQLVRQFFGTPDGHVEESSIRARTHALFGGQDANRVADFLLELAGTTPSTVPSPQLRAARNDPQIMSSWLRRSFGEWLAAESRREPLLVVIEDLHWGDLASVTYIGDALRASEARSLMVLALARPEVHAAFPDLWRDVEVQEIALGRLSAAAAEKLVRVATGTLAPQTVSDIVRRAEGNPFYLEELVRCVVEGMPGKLPDTILAIAQSRLHQLETHERRVVRAASVFGEVFWQSGVEYLLGGGGSETQAALQHLVMREIFETRPEKRFVEEARYSFRHALLREAAYAMLTEEDRVTGHRLAGVWLESAGAPDPLMLAYHFETGREPHRAVPWLLRAQQAAYDGGNVQAALTLAARGAMCGAQGTDLATLWQIEAMARSVQGQWTEVVPLSRKAMVLLPVGSTQWFLAAAQAFLAATFLGASDVTAPLLQELLSVEVQPEPSGPYALAVFGICVGLVSLGNKESARLVVERVRSTDPAASYLDPAASGVDPAFALRLQATIGFIEIAESRLGPAHASLSEARRLATQTGDAWGRAVSSMHCVIALGESGAYESAEIAARETLVFCEATGLTLFTDWTRFFLAMTYRNAGRLAEGAELARGLLDRADPLLVAGARALLAQLLVGLDDHAAAREAAAQALDAGSLFPPVRAAAYAALALIELGSGRPDRALEESTRGLDAAEQSAWPHDHSILRLAHAEVLFALGRTADARAAIEDARRRIIRVASAFTEAQHRRAYEESIPENARALSLAAEWES